MLAGGALYPFAVASGADIMVPVPLHVKRIRQRGFNQAILVGGLLSRKWGLPFYRDGLCRTRWTEPQISLSVDEREKNVRGAFAVKKAEAFKGKRIILVDDVYTTGSTVSECARALKRVGAEAVFVVTVARAVLL
jgi:ComF family protein